MNLKPAFKPKGLLPTFWTTREYRFANFHHPYLCEFVKTLNRDGMPGLISLETQNAADPQSFDAYRPEPRVLQDYPVDEVEFQSGRAYEVYNWELFFHIPLLIADPAEHEPALSGGAALVPFHLRSDGCVRRSQSRSATGAPNRSTTVCAATTKPNR